MSCRRVLLAVLCAIAPSLAAQDLGVLSPDDEIHHFLERQQALGHLDGRFLSARPLSAAEATAALDSLAARGGLPRADSLRLATLRGRRLPGLTPTVRGRLGDVLYADGRNLLAVRDTAAGYALALNPILDVRLGAGRQTNAPERRRSGPVYTASRGVRTSGAIGRFFFESRVEEIQERPLVRRDTIGHLPRTRNTDVLNRQDPLNDVTYDYGRVAGLVGYRDRFVEARFGRDRVRLGAPQATLTLSNYAPVYDHLMVRTTVWRLQYTNVFAAMESYPFPAPGRALSRKYGAFHQLAISLPGRVEVQLFEGVVHLPDPESGRGQYDVSFLNPIIFYRHVEDSFNALGNKMLGLGASWVATPGVEVYGQALLTEFVARELFSGDGYWANKWGAQAGVHYASRAVPGLDVIAEAAVVRPYTYSHGGDANATHFLDPLGFPAGQNLYDVALRARYVPTPSLSLRADVWHTQRGRDTESTVFGGDPLRSYTDRQADYGVATLDGVRVDETVVEAEAAYQLLPGLYLGGTAAVVSRDDAGLGAYRSVIGSASLRWGLPFPSSRY